MLGIVILHILGAGGVLAAVANASAKYWLVWFLEIIAYGSVNVFGMLSGYLGIDKKHYSTFRLLELLFTVFCYSTVITIVFSIFDRSSVIEIKNIVISVFPVIEGRYWYVTCYVVVFLLMPWLNELVNNLNEQKVKTLSNSLFILLSVIPSVLTLDFFKTAYGYSAIWLIALYLFGACYKKINRKIFHKWTWYIILLCNVIVWGMKIVIYYCLHREMNYMISYTSPFIVIASIFFIQAFLQKDFELNPKMGKMLFGVSAAAFDVYIVHSHILIFDCLMNNHFQWIGNLPIYIIIFAVIGWATVIYLAGMLAYWVRCSCFKLLRIDTMLKRISKILDRIFLKGV